VCKDYQKRSNAPEALYRKYMLVYNTVCKVGYDLKAVEEKIGLG
jgi:hypothetical protein